MGTVSVSLPSDGETIDAADYNTPINTIVTALNGNLDSNNISEGGVVPNSLVDGTGTSWVWQDWTPTWTNLTVGNSTVVAKYTQIGKTVHFRLELTLGSTGSVGTSPRFSLPVTRAADVSDQSILDGSALYSDVSGTNYVGYQVHFTSSVSILRTWTSTATYPTQAFVSATSPFTWATGDIIYVAGTYEAA